MKEKFLNIRSLFLVLVAGTMLTACQKDKDNTTNDLVGVWTAGTITADTQVGGKPLIQYFTDLGYSAADAQLYSNLFTTTIQQAFSGQITFKSDNTYTTNFGGQNDSGTWTLSPDGKQLTIDSSTDNPFVLNIESLTKNQLVVNWNETDNADINGDNTPENITVKLRMTLTK
ncbi:MAG TPA: lipocalin family protein [Bacteroidales bacterium]|jgi:hypothetical protein|nr:lipocalin family protein [Bacteroidales bacterium]